MFLYSCLMIFVVIVLRYNLSFKFFSLSLVIIFLSCCSRLTCYSLLLSNAYPSSSFVCFPFFSFSTFFNCSKFLIIYEKNKVIDFYFNFRRTLYFHLLFVTFFMVKIFFFQNQKKLFTKKLRMKKYFEISRDFANPKWNRFCKRFLFYFGGFILIISFVIFLILIVLGGFIF